jgi:hypothetical protein
MTSRRAVAFIDQMLNAIGQRVFGHCVSAALSALRSFGGYVGLQGLR